ncbi:MAG: glycosyltransferase, partial [Clostridia bacterium]|nr:glycosyltransferase [Clostridia bacterium]
SWRPLRQDVHLVPNGCDADHFGQARRGTVPPPPPDLAGVPRPAAGYVGALAPWVDGDLVAALARRYPDWSFVFIGAPFGWSPPDLPNCFRMGLKPYEELPRYLAHLDVLLIPYRADRVTLAASPAKFFEYAATGRPIVATALPALRPFAHAAFLAESPAAFLELLPAALADRDPAREAARLAVARDNTWDERADRVARILTDALTRRGGWGRG